MAKLVVPPTDPRLHEILHKVLQAKLLQDDHLWSLECLPLLYTRLDALHALVREAQVANAHTPDTSVVDYIFKSIDRMKSHLKEHFEAGAPFTVHRLAELVVEYADSGYLLTTVLLAQKYVLALSRTISVLSKETDFSNTLGDPKVLGNGDMTINGLCSHEKDEAERAGNGHSDTHTATPAPPVPLNGEVSSEPTATDSTSKRLRDEDEKTKMASAQDYEDHDLPSNIRFVALPWAEPPISSKVQDFDVENSVNGVESKTDTAEKSPEYQAPPLKKMKTSDTDSPSPEKAPFKLLSPLNMEGKIEEGEYSQSYYQENSIDYKVDRNERYSEEVLFQIA